MKKNFFVKGLVVFLICAVCCVNANAQNTFSQGDKVVNLGLGLASGWGHKDYKIAIPPLSGSFEYCIIDNLFNDKSSIGVGGYFGHVSYKDKHVSDWNYSYTIIGARAAFHYQLVDNLDTHAGVMAGYNLYSSSYKEIRGSSAPAFDVFLGARYYFLNNLGAFAEVGWGGIAYLQLGLAVKF